MARIAWLVWALVHVFNLIGFRNRILVMIQWAWSYLTYGRGARLIHEGWERHRRPGAEPRATVTPQEPPWN